MEVIIISTKYSMVKGAIESRIIDGTYVPHQKIHSESELMKEFNVSRHTVRQAIGDLVTAGWLYRIQGSGTFCADRSKLAIHNGSQKNIAIITTYISDYIFPSIIRGAEAQLSEAGYRVSIFSTNNDYKDEKRILETILSHNFDGVIVEPTKSAYSNPNINYYLKLENQSIPYIMINAYYDELEPIHIMVDDEVGGFKQTEHLINLGHTNIVGCFKTDDMQGTQRMKGFLKAHRKHDILLNPNNIITYKTEEKNKKPVQEFEKILSLPNSQPPTALVCYNDELAMNILDVLRIKNLNVPDDLSVVGYDDSFLASISEVKLTTIVHPKSNLGKTAADLIIEMIELKKMEKEIPESLSVVYPAELKIRNSTQKIGASTSSAQ